MSELKDYTIELANGSKYEVKNVVLTETLDSFDFYGDGHYDDLIASAPKGSMVISSEAAKIEAPAKVFICFSKNRLIYGTFDSLEKANECALNFGYVDIATYEVH